MHQLQRSWVRSQHPSAQWNLKCGRRSSAEFSTKKNICCGKEEEITIGDIGFLFYLLFIFGEKYPTKSSPLYPLAFQQSFDVFF
jgi:hypothetical protein